MNKKMKKLLSKLGMVLTVTAISTTSLMATEVAQEPQFSNWAHKDLYDAQNYGILDAAWVQDGMKGTIDTTTFSGLQQLVQNKLAAIPGTKPKDASSALTTSTEITKQEVLNMLYATLQNNEYEHELKLDLEGEAITTYMQELEVIKGDGKSLGLDAPCTEEQAVVMARRFIESVYDVCDADSTGLFWKVEKNGNTVYMLGAIHFGRASMYPMSDDIENAYDDSDEFAVEVNILKPAPQEAMDIQMYSDGTTIKDHLDEEDYEILVEALQKYNITPEALGTYKDWVIAQILNNLQTLDTSAGDGMEAVNVDGIDGYYMNVATIQNRPITELESHMLQLEMMDNKGAEYKELELAMAIESLVSDEKPSEEELSEAATQLNEMAAYWCQGDAAKLKDYVFTKEEGELDTSDLTEEEKELVEKALQQADDFKKVFWDDRDKGMAEKIEAMLNSEEGKTYFVTVGAGHYISDTGIIGYLKDKGYEVTQIK